jgi:small ligand-binding sensory domain FIST
MSSATSTAFHCASALSTQPVTEEALREAISEARESLGGSPDLALLFLSPHHARAADHLAADACDLLGTNNVLGCTGEAIAGTGREVEDEPALSLWLARWPGVTLTPLHLEFERTPEGGALEGWPDELAGEWRSGSFLIVLGEPFSFPADFLLERINEDRPGVPVVGGMASGAAEPGENRLILGPHTYAEGAVAVHVSGPVRLRTVVSQGCRPIGRPFVVTKAERNVIAELGGKPALAQLREIFAALPTSEQRLAQRALHLGRVVSEYKERFEQGDFLVRNVVGIDANSGAIAIGDYIRPGQTVQFHIRDQDAADAELKQLLAAARPKSAARPAGALLFTCNGRGTRMFHQPHHDAAAISAALGPLPLAGFFAQGELGPIGNQNFIHGFTASVALFEAEA